MEIRVRFFADDPETPWHAQLNDWACWCQAKTAGEAADGIVAAMRETPDVKAYRDLIALIDAHPVAADALCKPHETDAHADSAPHA